jgi:hypothetical protein
MYQFAENAKLPTSAKAQAIPDVFTCENLPSHWDIKG